MEAVCIPVSHLVWLQQISHAIFLGVLRYQQLCNCIPHALSIYKVRFRPYKLCTFGICFKLPIELPTRCEWFIMHTYHANTSTPLVQSFMNTKQIPTGLVLIEKTTFFAAEFSQLLLAVMKLRGDVWFRLDSSFRFCKRTFSRSSDSLLLFKI